MCIINICLLSQMLISLLILRSYDRYLHGNKKQLWMDVLLSLMLSFFFFCQFLSLFYSQISSEKLAENKKMN